MVAILTVVGIAGIAIVILMMRSRDQHPVGAFRSSPDSSPHMVRGGDYSSDDEREGDHADSDAADSSDSGSDSGGGDSGGGDGSSGDGGGE